MARHAAGPATLFTQSEQKRTFEKGWEMDPVFAMPVLTKSG
jgi:hypothetical protein